MRKAMSTRTAHHIHRLPPEGEHTAPAGLRLDGRSERSANVKGFRMPPSHRQRGCTEAGVRKASREETAGEFAPALVSGYGDLAPVFDLIFDFRSGKTIRRTRARKPAWSKAEMTANR